MAIKKAFKNCAPFTDSIREINNTQVDNARYNDVVMPMYKLIEYRNNHEITHEVYGNIIVISSF